MRISDWSSDVCSSDLKDFTGGEFVLTEQRPRMQSRAEVVPLQQGEGVIFPVHHRPVQGSRGIYRVNMRHGVSRLRPGERFTLGVLFHVETRPEERRVGKECGSTYRSRFPPSHK